MCTVLLQQAVISSRNGLCLPWYIVSGAALYCTQNMWWIHNRESASTYHCGACNPFLYSQQGPQGSHLTVMLTLPALCLQPKQSRSTRELMPVSHHQGRLLALPACLPAGTGVVPQARQTF